MHKKIIILLFLVLMQFAICACADNGVESNNQPAFSCELEGMVTALCKVPF